MGDPNSITPRAQQLLAEAKGYLVQADDADRQADAAKWAAAERMWQAHHEEGASWTTISEAVGLARRAVAPHVEVWAKYGVRERAQRPTFTEAYMEVRGPTNDRAAIRAREARAHLRDAPPEERARVAAELVEDEATADALVSQHPAAAAQVYGATERAHPAPEDRPRDRAGELDAEARALREFPRVRALLMEWTRRTAGTHLGTETRGVLLELAADGHEAITQVEEVLRAGDLDAALAAMLGGE